MSIEMSSDLREWFRERLGSALSRRAVSATDSARYYLVDLLARFAERQDLLESLDRPLALQLAAAGEVEGMERLRRYRTLGDAALYISGFFADHLERRGVTRDYVVSMGGRAYASASALAPISPSELVRARVYSELAQGFDAFASALDEVREATTLRTPQDIVRLYDRWRRTRSPELAARLRDEGVFPQVPSERGLLH